MDDHYALPETYLLLLSAPKKVTALLLDTLARP